MKVESNKKPVGFQPVQVSLTFEEQKELDYFLWIMRWNKSIPELIEPDNKKAQAEIQALMDTIRHGVERGL